MSVRWTWLDESGNGLLDGVRTLFLEYQEELGVDLCFQSFQEELDGLPGKYSPPIGALLVGVDGEPFACGALRDLGDGVCELKRIYIRPSHRGEGLGKFICEALLAKAKEVGYETARLDTLAKLTTAVKLYEKLGFRQIEPYSFNPGLEILYYERAL